MSFKKLSRALAEALIEDLSRFTPFSMAVMSEYGRVGGYAETYLELKLDILGFLDLCAELRLQLDLRAVEDLPELVPDRLMREEFFIYEQATLIHALQDAELALGAAAEGQLEAQARALDRDFRRRFDQMLYRSGLDPDEILGQRRSDAPRGARIYVTSRYSARLLDQVCGFLAESGLDPIVAPTGGAGQFDLDRAAREMDGCAGGVFGVTRPDLAATRQSGELASEKLIADTMAEISLAERRMGRRQMILAQERLAALLPDLVRNRPIMTMRDIAMDEIEFSLFKTVASRTPWLTS